MTITVEPHPALASRRRPVTLSSAARVPAGVEAVGLGVLQGARSVRLPDGGTVDQAWLKRAGFEGRKGQTVVLPSSAGSLVLAVGLGPSGALDADSFRTASAALVRAARQAGTVAFVPGAGAKGPGPAGMAQAVGEGAVLGAYRFTTFKSQGEEAAGVDRFVLVAPRPRDLDAALERGATVAGAVALARDLVNEPAGSLTPTRMAEIAVTVAGSTGLSISVLGPAEIQAERLGGLSGVAQGSDEEARLVRLEYRAPRAPAKVALVGKGITFDSGGLSLKTAEGMMTMKTDMGGAAAVLATMSVLGAVGVPVDVVGFLPLTENMPGGRAIKPGDVLRPRNGKTVEVLNTDAEGRLVLADGLSLAAEESPAAIIDLATLTGAVVVALGRRIAGLMGNDDALCTRLEDAATRAGERVWRLPLPADYRKDLDSEVADMKNIGAAGAAGSIAAGLFLQEFAGGVPWAHLDIAGTARSDSDEGWLSKGGTGFGVRTLVELLAGW